MKGILRQRLGIAACVAVAVAFAGAPSPASAADYRSTVIADDPVVYYRLGETSGTVAHEERGTGLNGAYQGGTSLGVQGALTDPNPAAQFDGNNDQVTVPDAARLRIPGDITVEAWMLKRAEGIDWTGVVGKGNATQRNYGLWEWIGTDGRAFFQQTNTLGQAANAFGTTHTQLDRWYHVVGVAKGTNVFIYVDGQLEGVSVRSGTISTTADPLTIAYAGVLGHFPGVLDEVAVYNKALSSGQIYEHYRAAQQPYPTAPPTISGEPREGSELTASTGTWNGSPTFYAYQWQRCDAGGTSCADIAEANSRSYRPGPADVGQTLRVSVIAVNTFGSEDASSQTTEPVMAAPPEADLALSKSDSPDPVTEGELLTYVLDVANQGPDDATGAEVTDTLPASVEFVSASAGCSEDSGTVTCDLGSIPAGTPDSAHITVRPTQPGTITNTASASADQGDPNTSNDSDTEQTTVSEAPPPRDPSADLALSKSDSPDPVTVGGVLTYALRASNLGPDDATNVTVTDTLPASVEFLSASSECTRSGRTVTCELGSVPAGTARSVGVRVRPISAGTIQNAASVSGDQDDPRSSNNASVEQTVVRPPRADLSLRLGAPDAVRARQDFSYTVTARNGGPDTARNAVVRTRLSAGQRFLSASRGCSYARWSRTVTCSVGDLAAGGSRSRGLTVEPTYPGSVSARGSVSSNTGDPRASNNTDVESVTVRRQSVGVRCSLVATAGNDVIVGTSGNDVICAGRGNDVVTAKGGNDTVFGGPGRDTLRGNAGADRLFGEGGEDVINSSDGVSGNDLVDGGAGSDTCNGDPADRRRNCP